MRNLTEQNITEAVLNTFAGTPNPRLKEIVTSLVKHIHAFAREVELTEGGCLVPIFTCTGHMSDDKRQEFICCDTLGLTT
jgi:hydroxyquinol 1,2-dioxygenase